MFNIKYIYIDSRVLTKETGGLRGGGGVLAVEFKIKS